MPRCVIKPHPEKDEYVIWSTVVDSPVSGILTRKEAVRAYPGGESSVARADETGASWSEWRDVFWGTRELIREIRVGDEYFNGMCQFEDIPDIIRAWTDGDAERLRELIKENDEN